MVKVCKVSNNDKEILRNLYLNREGLRVQTLIKLTNLKQRVLYKRLDLLRKRGLIENIFPIWKLINGQVGYCATLIKSSNIFELHNLSYVLKLMKTPVWWSTRRNRLLRLKGWQFKDISFGKGASNPYQQLINENFVIQTYPESIIIIARKRYYSNQPYEVIIQAMNDVLDLISWFEERMKFKFFFDGVPCLEIRNNDYNRIKDYLAEHCKKEGNRFLVEIDKNRKVWVDYSEPFGKEANYPEGQEKLERVTKDILLNNPPLPSELAKFGAETNQGLNILIGIVSNQIKLTSGLPDTINQLQKQIESHLKLIQEYRHENIAWRKNTIKKLKKDISLGHQSNLKDFDI